MTVPPSDPARSPRHPPRLAALARRATTTLLAGGALAFLAAWRLELVVPSPSPFDLGSYPLMAGILGALALLHVALPARAADVAHAGFVAAYGYLLLKLGWLLLAEPDPALAAPHLLEGVVWLPVAYLLVLLSPRSSRVHWLLGGVTAGTATVVLAYVLGAPQRGDLTLLPGVVQIAVAMLLLAGISSAYLRLRSAREDDERLHRALAFRDPLTGLANRRRLESELERLLEEPGARVAVMFLDLDGFKAVNDAAGHEAGDEVLRVVATRIEGALRSGTLLARLGGDEFVVVVRGAGRAEALAVADRTLAALRAPVEVGGRRFALGASIGVRLRGVPRGASDDAGALLRDADAAMYVVKRTGKDAVFVHGDLEPVER